MLQPFRVSQLALVVVMVAGFLQPLATPDASPVPDGQQVYVAHASRMTALIPDAWAVPIGPEADYAGDDGFVLSYGLEENGTGDACAAFTATPNPYVDIAGLRDLAIEPVTWRGEPACELTGTLTGEAKGLVVPLPETFDWVGLTIGYGVLLTDAEHFDQITDTLEVTDARLTPETYLSSVIDIIEARSWWTALLDWDFVRTLVLSDVNTLPSYQVAAGPIELVLELLRGQGDNHSFTIPPSDPGGPSDTSGVGMIVGGQQVLAVFPDGPAARAGLQRGDVIEELNGFPVTGEFRMDHFGQGGWPEEAQLVVSRAGEPEPFEVTLTRGPYTTYLPPSGERVGDNLGYIEIDQFKTPGRESDYAKAGNTVLREVDSPAVCGWIVDLRLNLGGGYAPMLSAVGPILGDGPFFGYQFRDGRGSMVSYQDGAFVFASGRTLPDFLATGTRYMPEMDGPPVAVLTSSVTGSAGEAATLAFVGRDNTQVFGEKTAGLTVGNTVHTLWDGTLLALADGAYVDRNGTVYTDGVSPDVAVTNDWATFRTDDDPVIAAASAWLQEQPGCAATATATPT